MNTQWLSVPLRRIVLLWLLLLAFCAVQSDSPAMEIYVAVNRDAQAVLGMEDGDPLDSRTVSLPKYGAGESSGPAYLTFAADPEEYPVVSAGVPVTGWKRLVSAPAESPARAVSKVWVADIPAGLERSHTLYDAQGRVDDRSLQISDGRRFVPKDHYPAFTWDTIPLYMHMRKATSFTQEELNYLAGFPLITLEKTTGSTTYGSSEDGSREAARAIKAVNPEARVLYYRNVMCNYDTYQVNKGLRDIPGAFLVGRHGNTQLHRGKREVYDLSNPALRRWWVDHCVEMAQYDEIDGVFLDGNIKALEPEFLSEETGAERKQEVAEGYAVMMQDLKDRIPSDKLLVANIIRARLTDSGLDYLQYFDGSYLEGIESPANGLTRLEYVTKGIAAIQQAAREGKIICMSMGLGRAALRGLRIDDSRQRLAPGANMQPRLEYCLALFLICAEKYSYVYPHDGYDVNNHRSSIWLRRFAEYDKPLGPPKGPATQEGFTYTREFEYASVFLDIENEEAKITWKERSPQ